MPTLNINNDVVLFPSANVGIGTTAPSYRLQIGNSGGLSDSIRIGDYQVTPNTRQYIGYTRHDSGLFESSGNGDTPSTVMGGVAGIRIVNTVGTVTPSQADNSIQLLTHIYNGNSKVALHANFDGNVGIGTTAPVTKLHVAGAGNVTGGNIHMGDNTDAVAKWSFLTGAHYNGATNPSGISLIGCFGGEFGNSVVIGGSIYEANPATDIQFWTHTATTHNLGGSERMRITAGGNVLINTTTDSGFKLDVNGTGRFSGALTAGNVSATRNTIGTIDIGFSGSGYGTLGYNIDYTSTNNTYNYKVTDYSWMADFGNESAFRIRFGATGSGGTPISYANYLTIANSGAATFSSSVSAVSALLQSANTNAVVDIFTLNNPSATSSGVRQKFANGYGDLAAIRVSQIDNGAGADNGKIEFQTATNAALSTKLTILDNGAATFSSSVTATKALFYDSSGVGAVLEAFNTVATNASTAVIRQTGAGGNGNQDIGLLVDIQGAADSDRIANFRYFDGTTFFSRMAIMRGGNVGIGTTAPTNKLDVSVNTRTGTHASSQSLYVTADMNTGDTGTASGNVEFRHSNGTQGIGFGYNTIYQTGGGTNTNLNILSRGTSAITLNAFAYSTGNVLIGTTTDSGFKLDVAGTFRASSSGIVSKIQTSTNATEVLQIFNSGGNDGAIQGITHLGINFFAAGTNSPVRITAFQNGTSGFAGGMAFSTRSDNSDVAPTEKVTILSGGNVGINTNNPSQKLEVLGNIRITTGSLGVNVAPDATNGRIDASNDIVAFSTSDSRLKENITPIPFALEKVKALTGVMFDWKEETKAAHGHSGRDTGIIAQEVQAVMPTAVRTNDTGYLAVRYEKLIGLLIEGMKEQQAQIDELKAQINDSSR